MDKMIRPFGLFGSTYRTDALGASLMYASYLPAILVVALVFIGINPVATKERAVFTLLISLLFVAAMLALAVRRSERVR